MISALAGTAPSDPVMSVDKQTVSDIMRRIKIRHAQCAGDYDKIYTYFEGGSIRDICKRLWTFCRSEFEYVEESVKEQFLSCPYTILTGGKVDCKNYSLFCAGVLDAMKRAGKKLTWCFRFACYEFDLFDMDPGHVFVVVNEATDNIWVDPVLGDFDYHLFYWSKKDKKVDTVAKGVAGLARVGSAENNLMNSIKQYSDGVDNAMSVAVGSQTLNSICLGVMAGVGAVFPVVGAIFALVKVGSAVVNNAWGPGSKAGMLMNDATNPFTAPYTLIATLFNGRTYNTDQYWAAQYYQYYVQGKSNVTTEQKVADGDVTPALKWFIDRLGVFISGREHLIALTKSPQDYMNYFKVNPDTTTDIDRVTRASNVAKQYFDFNGAAGSWAGTIGVYDETLVAIAQQMQESIEKAAAQKNYDQSIYSPSSASPGTPGTYNPYAPGAAAGDNTTLYLIGGGLLLAAAFVK